MPANSSPRATLATLRLRSSNRRSGVMGCSARSSVRTKAASRTAPPTNDDDRERVGPAVGGGPDEAVDQGGHPEGGDDRAGRSKRAAVALRSRAARRAPTSDHGEADRDVDEQHPAPGRPLGEHAAEIRPRAPPPIDTAVKRPSARIRSRPSGNIVVSRASEDGAASAPPTPCRARAASRKPPAGGEAAEQRGDDEHGDAGEEGAAAAEEVAGPGAEQQQAAEGQRVGVEDPGQAGAGEAQRAAGCRAARRSRWSRPARPSADRSGSRASTRLAWLGRRRRRVGRGGPVVRTLRGRGDCVGGHVMRLFSGVQ